MLLLLLHEETDDILLSPEKINDLSHVYKQVKFCKAGLMRPSLERKVEKVRRT